MSTQNEVTSNTVCCSTFDSSIPYAMAYTQCFERKSAGKASVANKQVRAMAFNTLSYNSY